MLVIGEDRDKIAKKYSLDTEVDKYLRYKFDDAAELHVKYLKNLENLIKAYQAYGVDTFVDYYKDIYDDCLSKDDFEFYRQMTNGCWYDDDGNAWSTENPNAYYQYEKCYDERIRKNQDEEASFSNPFKLKDGKKAYSAKKGEIDWSKMHMPKDQVELNEATWDMCVNGREPSTELEKRIYDNMRARDEYFSNFKDSKEYVTHQCSFWTYSVATEDNYISGDSKNALEWARDFYDKYIVPLPDDTRLSIYEIKLL